MITSLAPRRPAPSVAVLAAVLTAVATPARAARPSPTPLIFQPGPLGSGTWRAPCALGPLRTTCFVDTGARSSWAPAFDVLAWLPSRGPAPRAGIDGATEPCHAVSVSRLGLGEGTRSPSRLVVCPPRADAEATLGIDVLARSAFTFDALAGAWTPLGEEDAVDALRTHPVTGELRTLATGHLALDVDVGGAAPALGVFDTGAGLSVVDEAFLAASGLRARDRGPVDVGTSTGGSLVMRLWDVDGVRIGGRAFDGVAVLATDLSKMRTAMGAPVDVIVGANLIHGACWTLAPAARRFGVTDCGANGDALPTKGSLSGGTP